MSNRALVRVYERQDGKYASKVSANNENTDQGGSVNGSKIDKHNANSDVLDVLVFGWRKINQPGH
jgi:hypothetical protein